MEYEPSIAQKSKWKMKGSITGLRNAGPPRGCLIVYVGKEEERFIIAIEALHHPCFTPLPDSPKRVVYEFHAM